MHMHDRLKYQYHCDKTHTRLFKSAMKNDNNKAHRTKATVMTIKII